MQNVLDLNFPREPGPKNILPHDGEAIYYGPIFASEQSARYFDYSLTSIPWKNDEVEIYGKHIVTARKIAWYGDKEHSYAYSNTEKVARLWTPELLELKKAVEKMTGTTFDSCLLNLYENGEQGLGWHQDGEKELEEGAVIASLSFGAERRFDFRHKDTKEKISIILEHGSLLVMKGQTQKYWYHQVPKSKKITEPRVNLTFRKMRSNQKN